LLNYSRFRPRLERHFSPTLSGFAGYRLEFLKFNEVASSTIQTLGGIRREGVLSGPSLGVVWDTTEDPLNPTQGGIVSLFANQAGKIWGGEYEFFSLTAEAKRYQRIGWGVVLASRLEIGLSDAFGSRKNMPLSERFYAGGEGSVRGYGRRKLGPLNGADDPLGGLSLVEGSVELRRPLWRNLSGAIFLDFGQVSLDSYDLPFDDLQFAPGFGMSYATPVGPLRLDIGFPINPAEDDGPWQVHFSIGQYF
jgi:outer membrane translocation and assembly module TamA